MGFSKTRNENTGISMYRYGEYYLLPSLSLEPIPVTFRHQAILTVLVPDIIYRLLLSHVLTTVIRVLE
jgi:hypothetical protein